MAGVSVMADRGFTIREKLANLGIELNLPPFMESRSQLPAEDVQRGRSIASLRIHVERAIGRMKQFNILTSVFPLKMARIANQIVTVCAYLSNFHPALVPVPVFQPDSVDHKDDEKADGSEQLSEEDSMVDFDDISYPNMHTYYACTI